MAAAVATNAKPAPEGQSPNQSQHNSSLYVGDLDRDVGESQLFDIFSQAGSLAIVCRHRDHAAANALLSVSPQTC